MNSEHLAGGRLTVDLGAIVENWKHLNRQSRPGKASAVVKANAYGLGISEVAPALAKAGCDTFFVALPGEGVKLRALLPEATVYVLNGIHSDVSKIMIENELRPVLSSYEHVGTWKGTHGAPCAIQVDTGMNRLGVSVEDAISLSSERPVNCTHVMSHFACADTPAHWLNNQQIEQFQLVSEKFSGVESSLSNSAAIISKGALGHDLTRPGIALYGGEAVNGMANLMQPVVSLEARIVQVREAKAGETVSYGATHTLKRDSRLAIVSVGYADGYPRSASGSGVPLRDTVQQGTFGAIRGHRIPLLGRVTMDLMCFDVTDIPTKDVDEGWIELLGPTMSIDDVARAAGTIGYEILTSFGARYARRSRNL
ncbi:MAG: alanine racemase [Pseudomonadota bacterium]